MYTTRMRSMEWKGEIYLSYTDLLLWLSKMGELPNLNDDQRRLMDTLLKDLRSGEIEYNDRGSKSK